jgi:hypothetical protein
MFELYVKYLLEGIAVAVAAYFIPRKRVQITEIIFIALSAAATFALLDVFAPKVGDSARRGAGFGIGANTVGWPGVGLERFEDSAKANQGKASRYETFEDSESSDDDKKKSDDSTETTETTETFTSESTETKSEDSSKSTTESKDSDVQPFETGKKYSTF